MNSVKFESKEADPKIDEISQSGNSREAENQKEIRLMKLKKSLKNNYDIKFEVH
jgi:hypothetical protein